MRRKYKQKQSTNGKGKAALEAVCLKEKGKRDAQEAKPFGEI